MHQLALGCITCRDRHLFGFALHIEPKLSASFGCIGTMTMKAMLSENRPNLAIELDLSIQFDVTAYPHKDQDR
jgi:hypothetical protein